MSGGIGKIDRSVRMILAVVILILFYTEVVDYQSTIGLLMSMGALIFILTAIFGYCALYEIAGISTKKK